MATTSRSRSAPPDGLTLFESGRHVNNHAFDQFPLSIAAWCLARNPATSLARASGILLTSMSMKLWHRMTRILWSDFNLSHCMRFP